MSRIFRQEALKRLASPEQLDHLIQVIRPKDWLVLVLFALQRPWRRCDRSHKISVISLTPAYPAQGHLLGDN